jgi:hypothetical protein
MATTPLPLNKFRLIGKKLNSGDNTIYQEDLDVATIILSCQVSNLTTGSTEYITVLIEKIDDVGNPFTLVKNAPIPPKESLNPFTGKIVLERNDKLIFNVSSSGTMEAVLSVLENAIN